LTNLPAYRLGSAQLDWWQGIPSLVDDELAPYFNPSDRADLRRNLPRALDVSLGTLPPQHSGSAD